MKMRTSRFHLLMTALLVLACGSAAADWTAQGTFNYTDRTYDDSGFTGTATLPVRKAVVEIYDTSTLAVLATTETDASGAFSTTVVDASTRDVSVRVNAETPVSAGASFSVQDDANANAIYTYTDASVEVTSHGSTTDVNFGTMTMPSGIGTPGVTDPSSQVFNTFDMCWRMAEWIENVDGALPSAAFSVAFNPTNGRTGSFYNGGTNIFSLSDDDAYDDPNIIHELGHYVEDEYGQSANTGGYHLLGDDDQDPRLAWSEGFATFVSNSVLDYAGLARPDIYQDRDSFDAGGAGFSYSLEPSYTGGATNEVAVNGALYDLIDSSATADASSGSDDDPMSNRQADVWAVVEEFRVRNLPAVSMEDFWDVWFDLGNGSLSDMQTVFSGQSIHFFTDGQEPNDRPEDAAALPVDGGYISNTFYKTGADAYGDEDWFAISVTAGTYYRVEVNGAANSIFGRPDPEMFLIDLANDVVLAHNNDPYDSTLNAQTNSSAQDMGETVPSILFQAPATQTYYVVLRHASRGINLQGRYGTYQVQATSLATPTPTVTSVAVQELKPGQTYQAAILGADFSTGAVVSTTIPSATVATTWLAESMLVADIAVPGGASTANFDLSVSNPGSASSTASGVLRVNSAAQPPLAISEVELGADAVEVVNLGTVAADLTGFTIVGRRPGYLDQTFTFPSYSLPAGSSVVVFESGGTDTAFELFDQGATLNWSWFNGVTGNVALVDAGGYHVDGVRFIERIVDTHEALAGTDALWFQPEILSPEAPSTVSRSIVRGIYHAGIGLDQTTASMPLGSFGNRDNEIDILEPNNDPLEANILSLSALVDDLAISPQDVGTDDDWHLIPVEAGDNVTINVMFTDVNGDIDAELYAPGEDATPLVTADSSTDNETIVYSAVDTLATGGGLYRLRVYGFSGATNTYSIGAVVPVDLSSFSVE